MIKEIPNRLVGKKSTPRRRFTDVSLPRAALFLLVTIGGRSPYGHHRIRPDFRRGHRRANPAHKSPYTVALAAGLGLATGDSRLSVAKIWMTDGDQFCKGGAYRGT